MAKSKLPTIFLTDENGDEHEQTLPWRWVICDCCDGHGTSSRRVECAGGGFTASEWAEQDDDFREDYLAGRYDEPCGCEGGRVREVDWDRLTDEQRTAWNDHCEAERFCRAEEAAERRYFGSYY